MSFQPYTLDNMDTNIILQKYSKKFWEIAYDNNHRETTIVCGRLLKGQYKDTKKTMKLQKIHQSHEQALKYMNDRVIGKLKRGYGYLNGMQTRSVSDASVKEDKNEMSVEDLHMSPKSPIKKVRTDNLSNERYVATSTLNRNELILSPLSKSKEERKEEIRPSTVNKEPKSPSSRLSFFEIPDNKDGADLLRGVINSMNENDRKSKYDETPSIMNRPKSVGKNLGGPSPVRDASNLKKKDEAIDKMAKIAEEKKQFDLKVQNLRPEEMPFGRPVFQGYNALAEPSTWENQDVTGWYLSEKLGGIRCFWDGFEMWSKKGNKYKVAHYICERLPKSPLDGELCTDKGKLSKCIAMVKKNSDNIDWNDFFFVIHDAPGLELPFRDRLEMLKKADFLENWPYAKLHTYKKCEGREHVLTELAEVEKQNKEGLLLRDPDSLYKKGKSKAVLEVRSYFEEKAVVEECIKGKGRYEGQMGSLRVRKADGTEFLISKGFTDDLRSNPPKVKSVIIYKFNAKLDEKKPKDPIYVKTVSEPSLETPR